MYPAYELPLSCIIYIEGQFAKSFFTGELSGIILIKSSESKKTFNIPSCFLNSLLPPPG
jgi:hypothetical protein